MSSDLSRFESEAINPDWAEFDAMRKRVHEWRTYVSAEVRAAWDQIPVPCRCAIISCCEEAAAREDWD